MTTYLATWQKPDGLMVDEEYDDRTAALDRAREVGAMVFEVRPRPEYREPAYVLVTDEYYVTNENLKELRQDAEENADIDLCIALDRGDRDAGIRAILDARLAKAANQEPNE